MARTELKTYEPTGISWIALQEIDEGKSPMPNEGMKAIGRICDQAGVSMSALASVRSGGLSGLVAGNGAAMPAARSISGANAAALAAGVAGLGAAIAAKSSSGKEKKDDSEKKVTSKPSDVKDGKTINLFDSSDRAALKETLERDSRGLTTTTQSTPSKTPPPQIDTKETTTKTDDQTTTTTTSTPKCDPNLSTCPEPLTSSVDTKTSSSALGDPK